MTDIVFSASLVPAHNPGKAVAATVLCALLAQPLTATAGITVRLDNLPVKGFQWQQRHSVNLNGIPVHVRIFRSSGDAAEAAQRLAEYNMLFQHVVAIPGLIRLSGLHGNAHWLAEISPEPTGGARGRVSAIALEPARDAAAPVRVHDQGAAGHATAK